MINNHKITLCMPCRNEATHIKDLLSTVPKEVDEIILIDNRSTDDLELALRKIKDTRIKLKKDDRVDEVEVGYGYAHMSGFKAATGDIIVSADADGSYPLASIPEIVRSLLERELDVIICQRKSSTMSWFARLGGYALSLRIKLLLRTHLSDPLSGMWAIKKQTIKTLRLGEGGWDFSLEIKLKALSSPKLKVGTKEIKQVPRLGHSKQQYLLTGLRHMKYIKKYHTQTVDK